MGFAAEKPEPWTHIDIFKVFEGTKTFELHQHRVAAVSNLTRKQKNKVHNLRLDAGNVRRHFLMMHFSVDITCGQPWKPNGPSLGAGKATRRKNPCTSIRRSIVVFCFPLQQGKLGDFQHLFFLMHSGHSGIANFANLAFFSSFSKDFQRGSTCNARGSEVIGWWNMPSDFTRQTFTGPVSTWENLHPWHHAGDTNHLMTWPNAHKWIYPIRSVPGDSLPVTPVAASNPLGCSCHNGPKSRSRHNMSQSHHMLCHAKIAHAVLGGETCFILAIQTIFTVTGVNFSVKIGVGLALHHGIAPLLSSSFATSRWPCRRF